MTKKEIQEKINNLPKPSYLYQRYDGDIRKYEVQNNVLINVKNVNDIIDTDKHLLLGKTSENKLDLLDVGDLLIYKINDNLNIDIIKDDIALQDYTSKLKNNLWEFYGFITKEKLSKVINI
jgi:hypothetical protein